MSPLCSVVAAASPVLAGSYVLSPQPANKVAVIVAASITDNTFLFIKYTLLKIVVSTFL